jgi:hypothetical protein
MGTLFGPTGQRCRERKVCGGGPPHPPLRGGARPRTPQHRHGAAAQGDAGRQDGPGAARGKAGVRCFYRWVGPGGGDGCGPAGGPAAALPIRPVKGQPLAWGQGVSLLFAVDGRRASGNRSAGSRFIGRLLRCRPMVLFSPTGQRRPGGQGLRGLPPQTFAWRHTLVTSGFPERVIIVPLQFCHSLLLVYNGFVGRFQCCSEYPSKHRQA